MLWVPLRRGFTLIELLTVVAIIAILAAILFPVFSQAKQAAQKTACASNLKQMVLGLLLYAQDYDDHVVSRTYSNVYVPGDQISWYGYAAPGQVVRWDLARGLLSPYIKDYRLVDCPASAGMPAPDLMGNSYVDPSTAISVGINDVYLFYPYYPDSLEYSPVTLTQIEDPVETIAFGDAATFDKSQEAVVKYEYLEPPSLGVFDQGRHNKFCNLAWCDGHVKPKQPWIIPADLVPYSSYLINADLGQILKDGCPSYDSHFHQSSCVDYYFTTLSKPVVGG